jgi:hypothetical protein
MKTGGVFGTDEYDPVVKIALITKMTLTQINNIVMREMEDRVSGEIW